mgnify:CR=1 FL=1
MDSQSSISDYRVEVSGWDVAESFFVEKATLELSLDGARSGDRKASRAPELVGGYQIDAIAADIERIRMFRKSVDGLKLVEDSLEVFTPNFRESFDAAAFI